MNVWDFSLTYSLQKLLQENLFQVVLSVNRIFVFYSSQMDVRVWYQLKEML